MTETTSLQQELNDIELPNEVQEEEQTSKKKRTTRTKKTVQEKPEDPDAQNFKESTKRLSLQTCFERMAKSAQKQVIVKEIKIEESFDFPGSVAALRTTFQTEYDKKIGELDALYKTEVQRIKDKAALKNIPQMLAEMATVLRKLDWHFDQWQGQNVLQKNFSPYLPLTDCYSHYGLIRFKEPFCLLKSINVVYTNPKVGGGVYVNVQGVHPNVSSSGACAGTMSGRDIDLLNPIGLEALLFDLERQYKFGNLESPLNAISLHDSNKYDILKTKDKLTQDTWS